MLEAQLGGMQEHSFQPLAGQRPIPLEITVFSVPRNREPEVREVHSDLMRSSREQFGGKQGVGAGHAFLAKNGYRFPPLGLNTDAAFTGAVDILMQWEIDGTLCIAPLALDQGTVPLLCLPLAQCSVHRSQRRALLGEQQHARSLPVQAMNQFQKRQFRTACAQSFNNAERD